MSTLAYTGSLVTNSCWCGMHHAIPRELYDQQHRQWENGVKQTGIYCPLGHTYIISGEGEAEKLRKTLSRERDYAARLAAERDQAQASASAYKGVATRAKKRAAAATCPCCKRSFVQLRRHLEAKHPEYDGSVA